MGIQSAITHSSLFITASLLLLAACGEHRSNEDDLHESLTFYVSFDKGFTADFAAGDPNLYTAPSWDQRREAQLIESDEENLQIHENEGVYGHALWIDTEYNPVFFYRGENNISYKTENWSGTASFWLRLDPDVDLREGFSDPILFTSRGWNDRAFFVDFTDEVPRHFRFAVFPDREVWDPNERNWDEVPEDERPMLDVPGMPFSRDKWTHVALTFTNFNNDEETGQVLCYIDGEQVGILAIDNPIFSWEPGEVAIWIGYHYRGYFDELALFDRVLSEEEIQLLYTHKMDLPDSHIE